MEKKNVLLASWVLLSLLLIVIDYLTGPFIYVSILFLVPIVLSTWFNGRSWGLVFAGTLPLSRLTLSFLWIPPWSASEGMINAGIRIILFLMVVFLVDSEAKRRSLLTESKILKGLLPICCFCKKIRTQEDNWVSLEEYITNHSEAEFSHGFCPECVKKQYGFTIGPQT